MADGFSRRKFLAGSSAALGALAAGGSASALLAACGSSGTNSTAGGKVGSTKADAGISTATPKRGGNLVVATEAEDNGFNPTIASWDVTGLMYGAAIFDTLVTIDVNGKPQPFLAQSVTPNADATQFTITLRPGVKFHDGTAVDAAAVVQSLMANVQSPQNGPALLNVAGVTAGGPMTVLVSCKEPWPAFPTYLSGAIGTVMAPAMLVDPKAGNLKPVGSGPFVFKEWVPNDHLTVVRNPNYWQQGKPYLDSVTFKPIPDHQSRANALKAGDVDIMHTDDSQDVQQFTANSSFVSITDSNNSATEREVHFYMINTAKPPFDDLRVRQALAHATDQSRIHSIIDVVNTPITSPFSSNSPYYTAVDYPTYDLAKAKALLTAYQNDKGTLPTFQLSTVTDAKDLQRTTLVQAMWKEAGINCQVQQVEQSQYIVQALLGNYDVREWRQFAASDPDENYVWWSPLTASPIGKLALNFARNKDPQIGAMLEKGRTSLNQADRVSAYQEIGKRFAADVPYIWLDQTVWLVTAKPNVENFNNPTLPDGSPALKMTAGFINVGQIWRS
ncbi:MAG TPA: ABC transporter substrate-binding protein [Acidimicrobiales bacterium]|nr:ABC transporter substrate-binding protein [Acidimicrobiales bacterium]